MVKHRLVPIIGIDTDTDKNYIQDGYAIEAWNCYLGNGDNGGITENIKGTTQITTLLTATPIPSGVNTAIGSAEDTSRNIRYIFFYNANSNHFILAYRPKDDVIWVVLVDSTLNFSLTYPVNFNADVIGDLLYWTDGYNPPRKINILRAMYYSNNIAVYSSGTGYAAKVLVYDSTKTSVYISKTGTGNTNKQLTNTDYWTYFDKYVDKYTEIDEEVISAAKYAPNYPPECTAALYLVFNPLSNLKNQSFQFRYSYVKDDWEESATSPISKVIFSNIGIDYYNVIYVTLLTPSHIDKYIRLYLRNNNLSSNNLEGGGNNADWYLYDTIRIPQITSITGSAENASSFIGISDSTQIEELVLGTVLTHDHLPANSIVIKKSHSGVYVNKTTTAAITSEPILIDDSQIIYPFYNDISYQITDQSTVNRYFDALPDLAVNQRLIEKNRLVYGNITEGFDKINIDIQLNYYYTVPSFWYNDILPTPLRNLFASEKGFMKGGTYKFGIIYYDKTGKNGLVNSGTGNDIYIPTLTQIYLEKISGRYFDSDLDRKNAYIALRINHTAPDWATHYQIAVTKNTKISYLYTGLLQVRYRGNIDETPGLHDFYKLGSGTNELRDIRRMSETITGITGDPNEDYFTYKIKVNSFNAVHGNRLDVGYTYTFQKGDKIRFIYHFKSYDYTINGGKIIDIDCYDAYSVEAGKDVMDFEIIEDGYDDNEDYFVNGEQSNNSGNYEITFLAKNFNGKYFDIIGEIDANYTDMEFICFEIYRPKKEESEDQYSEIGECFKVENGVHDGNIKNQDETTKISIISITNYNTISVRINTSTNNTGDYIIPADIFAFQIGDSIVISNCTISAYNGTHTILGFIENDVIINHVYSVDASDGEITTGNYALIALNSGDIHYVCRRSDTRQITGSAPDLVWTYMGSDGLYELYLTQSKYYSDKFKSDSYDYGRSNVYLETARKMTLPSTIVYSYKYLEQSTENGLSKFFSIDRQILPEKFGVIRGMFEIGNMLKVIQDREVTSIDIGRVNMSLADGTSQMVGSETVLGSVRPSSNDYGTMNPESLVVIGNNIYFFDSIKGEVCRNDYNGTNTISGISGEMNFKMDKFFRAIGAQLKNGSYKIIGGYDRLHEQYLLTIDIPYSVNIMLNGNTINGGFTASFDVKGGVWKSFYDFYTVSGSPSIKKFPTHFFTINTKMISIFNGGVYLHDNSTTYNSFYGSSHPIKITLSSNGGQELSRLNKVFNCIGIISNLNRAVKYIRTGSPDNETKLMFWRLTDSSYAAMYIKIPETEFDAGMETRIIPEKFTSKEGVLWADIPGDTLDPRLAAITDPAPSIQYKILNGRRMRGKYCLFTIETSNPNKVELKEVIIGVTPSERN